MRASAQQLYLVSEILFGFSGTGIGITVFLGIRFHIWRQIRTDREESLVLGQMYPQKRRGWNLFAKEKHRDREEAEEQGLCGGGEEITADPMDESEGEKGTEAIGADTESEKETAASGSDTLSEGETAALSDGPRMKGR